MIDNTIKKDIIEYCNFDEIKQYKLWVYDGSDIIEVFYEQMPNTQQITFSFYSFSKYYWNLMQEKCVQKIKGNLFYDFFQLKIFVINYLLCNTNMSGVFIKRNKNGQLTKESFQSVIKIHPRILRSLFNIIQIFPKHLGKKQEQELEKQCHKLFGKGQGISNPHPFIVQYCNLMSFWDKFGMNYHDIMKLPNQVFISLKKIMSLDNEYKSQSLNKNTKGVGF